MVGVPHRVKILLPTGDVKLEMTRSSMFEPRVAEVVVVVIFYFSSQDAQANLPSRRGRDVPSSHKNLIWCDDRKKRKKRGDMLIKAIQIFGIACEPKPQQVNYLTDEHQTIGKDSSKSHGPNSVLSMLHHHLENYGSENLHLGLHADNCCGQNKNRSVITYLAWRVIVGLNKSIGLAFMRVGHTRCFVDGGFGFIKMKFRRNDVDTLAQLKDVVDGSVDFNVGVTYSWDLQMWDKFLARYFLPVRNITQYQDIQFDSDHPGEVHISSSDKFPNTTIKIPLPSANIDELSVDHLPEIIPPAGMSLARAQYLHKQVRPYCYEESRDATCPHPASIDYLVRDEQEAKQSQDQ